MLPLPLYLLRVLDLTQSSAGSYATRVLADLGAEVYKVEDLGQPDGPRNDFEANAGLNRNKLSIAMDTGSLAGRELCLRLAGTCDIAFFESDTDWVSYDLLAGSRQDLIAVSLSETETGSPKAGLAAAGAALAALFHRRGTGEGQQIKVAIEAPVSDVEIIVPEGSAEAQPASVDLDVLLRARGFYESVALGDGSVHEIDGVPYRFSRTPAHIRLPAPEPGQHTDYILRSVLGLTESAVETLRAQGVVGTPAIKAQ